ncbi:hypothetical protein O9K51_08143 [Purpureocillium lavendulum]|uniref:Protein NO VEIN C-terminal domain-containing protein n=1 Tax=Purpureocillium lavendulum TaxID=1247861 RepID=A0AB34FI09_9HYPO|nr:hypothetical protein O9K51_08143 [Purpureocillium lavendulum]
MDSDTRRTVRTAIRAKDKLIGSSAMLLARELYSRDVRFIFELLQNADDNVYSNATSVPYAAFYLFPKKVIVECNEDGFTEAHLRAICNIGNSSKVGNHGYTGEKGIGFKSVFKVAWKAHIQSGDFSFSFTHRPGDSGMGMISPEWEGFSGEPSRQQTRITLYLIDDDQATMRYESIAQQLRELESTMLLFLRRLKRIDVRIYNGDDVEVSSTALKVSMDEKMHKASLQKTHTQDGTSETTQTYCHVTKHLATGLAKSDNRTYTEGQDPRSYSTADVILAFPISEDSTPIVEAQQVFAFLPIRRLGFNFLIQTDFVTMANREDVVSSSPRNLALLGNIADAFITAIHQMYNHKTLRYQWMRYLRNMKTYPWETFWRRLVDKIEDKLERAELLEPRRRGSPRLLSDLCLLNPTKSDMDGNPLFEDLPGQAEKYISTEYRDDDLQILRDYGIEYMAQDAFLERVKHDLSRTNSRMRNPATSQAWHTRAAISLDLSFRMKWTYRIQETKALAILPLTDGRWISSNGCEVFFPVIGDGIHIPVDLEMNILALPACGNAERAKLFKNLGAVQANVRDVRQRILLKYGVQTYLPYRPGSVSLEISYSHLTFLYRTHEEKDVSLLRYLVLFDTEGRARRPSVVDCYFANDDPYSLWQLSQEGQDEWFKSNISFVHCKYFQNPPDGDNPLTWKSWLALLGVRDRPQLQGRNGEPLASSCLYVAKQMPSKFLHFLRYAWETEKESVTSRNDVVNALQSLTVLCQGGATGTTVLKPLRETYLPLPSLQDKSKAFLGNDFFPFLELGESLTSNVNVGNWEFLSASLGVGRDDNIHFYLDMLSYMKTACRGGKMVDPSRIRHAKQCGGYSILDFEDKYPLLARYQAAFTNANLNTLSQFFGNTLAIETFSWEHLVDELRFLKYTDAPNFDRVRVQYERLDQHRGEWVATNINVRTLRDAFVSEALIFVQDKHGDYIWVKPSECLWSTATEIRNKITLNNCYDDVLEDFFVKALGVSRITIDMVYDELYTADRANVTLEHVKSSLGILCTLLETEKLKPTQTPAKLLERAILPVRYPGGDVRLVSADVEFAIVDRRPLENLFRDRVRLLDFTLIEIVRLEPLLSWMNLGDRYLSKAVRHNSVVDPELTWLVSDPVRDIKRKAHALTRIATHLRSPRARSSDQVQAFYTLLLKAKTWETNGISATLILPQDGLHTAVELEQGEVCIDDKGDILNIYVPRDEESQDVCFGSALPEKLVEWMATDPTTLQIEGSMVESMVKVVTGLLGTRSPSAMQRILDMQGIVDIDVAIETPDVALGQTDQSRTGTAIDEPDRPQHQEESITFSTRSRGNSTSSSTLANESAMSTPAPSPTTGSRAPHDTGGPNDHEGSFSHDTYIEIQSHHHRHRQIPYRPLSTVTTTSSECYRELLQHIVACARATVMPRYGAGSLSTPADPLVPSLQAISSDTHGDWLRRESATSIERDCKVGAAGELFVYELLSSLLEDFGPQCWQSTMRRLVTGSLGHADHANIGPWAGAAQDETTDIVYTDTSGAFTRLLVTNEYLDAGTWANRQDVRYYIEVKSTFGECAVPFFMSDRQYNLMTELTTENSVYLIFRVFSMTSDAIGARIYADPDRMRREGQLKFSANRWAVAPVARLGGL